MKSGPSSPAEVVRHVASILHELTPDGLDATRRAVLVAEVVSLIAPVTDFRHNMDHARFWPLRSRAAVREYLASQPLLPDGLTDLVATDNELYVTDDPDVVVYEFTQRGTAGGERFAVRCLFVLRVENGLVTEFHNYTPLREFVRVARLVRDRPTMSQEAAV